MTDAAQKHQREALACPPSAVIERLPLMGRAMLTAAHGGATHERMGPISSARVEGAVATLSGEFHDARIDLDVIVRAVADRTGKMKDRALPRIEFQRADGEAVFSVIALEGLEPFEAALEPFSDGEPLPPKEKTPGDPAELRDGDPGEQPFAAARDRGDVTIAFEAPGLIQRWTGVVPEIKPAMGFINVMTADFHLHLRGGAVASWSRSEDGSRLAFSALDHAGAPTGLTVSGPASAFASR